MFVQDNLKEYMMQFAWSGLYALLRRRDLLSEPVIDISGVEIRPYLLGGSAYPS